MHAQTSPGLIVDGQITNEDGKKYRDKSMILVKKDTLSTDTLRINGGRFHLELELDSKYIIEFVGDNKYGKIISIDLNGIPEANRSSAFVMQMDITFFSKPLIPNKALDEWHKELAEKLFYSIVDDAIVRDIQYSEERQRLRAQIVGTGE
jgi:hypothetical protein